MVVSVQYQSQIHEQDGSSKMTDYDSGFEDGENSKQTEWELALKDVLPDFLLPDDDDEEVDPEEVAKYIARLREGKLG
jgi:hypothetical protein